jgi:phospholipid/cholesterol/gamma-HCH transport system permease protein
MNAIPFFGFLMQAVSFTGGLALLAKSCWSESRQGRFEFRLFVEQIYQIGTRSMPLIAVTAVACGMVMTLQFGIGLEKFGGGPYIPKIVSLSIYREMGPIFTSLMIAARVGAGIASEVGSMVVTQQVDAMRALGTSPIRRIVVPRVAAAALTLPILTTFANIIGIIGALMIGRYELRIDPHFFFEKAVPTNTISDYMVGVGKTFVFAFIISVVACYYGMNVKEGTKEVGIITTKAVVTSSILILVGDFFLTKLFWIIELWI